ncbi:hypothetical protein [Streptomyces chartreusis]|uniref:hypothetical protein n=1 Tax=Streptomyces chartreusis TaxID=1969 RepID=UPI0036646144
MDSETVARLLRSLQDAGEDDEPSPVAEGTERYVNAFVARRGEDEPAAPLAPLTDYELLLNIGSPHPASLVEQAEAAWPDELLPDHGFWLRAALLLEGQREATTAPFYLPLEGDSWVCSCTPEQPHAEACSPWPWVRLVIPALERPGHWKGELLIYYQAAAVVAMQVELPVGQPDASPSVPVVNKMTRSFTDLGKLSKRTASIVLLPQSDRIVINGVGSLDSPFAIEANAADTSAANVRTALFDSHFRHAEQPRRWPHPSRPGLRSRYDARFAKSHSEYEQDLRRLAREGQSSI